jgi:hypothetical protein
MATVSGCGSSIAIVTMLALRGSAELLNQKSNVRNTLLGYSIDASVHQSRQRGKKANKKRTLWP